VRWHGRARPPLTKQRIFPPVEGGPLKAWGRRRREPRIRGPRRPPRPAVGARHYRRRSGALPAIRRSLQSRVSGVRPAREGDRSAFVGICRHNRRSGARGILAALQGHARPIGAERGWPRIGRADFEREVEHGALNVGAPETVARKIAATANALSCATSNTAPARWHTKSSCAASSFMAAR